MANGTNWSGRKNAYYVQWRRNRKQQQQQQPAPTPAPQPQPPQAASPAPQAQPTPAPQPTPQQPQAQAIPGVGGGGKFGGYGNLGRMINAANQNPGVNSQYTPQQGNYTDMNNPALMKYQNQTPDKVASFLAGTDRNVNLNDPQYQDGYSYHDIPLNRLLARLGINKGPTVMNQKDFKAYCQQTGQTPMYRGWSSPASAQRFLSTTNNHVGNGRLGDGYYFSPDLSTARTFAGPGGKNIMPVVLSPTANVINLNTLRNMMAQEPAKLQSALRHAGTGGSGRTYGSNSGEAQYALMKGYNVVESGGYMYAITNDALVACSRLRS